MQKLTQPIIMIDKPQEAEDQHLQQIFQVFFALHLIYQLQCYMRKANPARLMTMIHGQKISQIKCGFFLVMIYTRHKMSQQK